jgi:hypothetical protein
MSEVEWSQNKKLIDFSKRPGGFRRSMVPNLPYFAVQFDYKGEKGYGHVIEGTSEAADAGEEDGALDEGGKGGGEFPRSVLPCINGRLYVDNLFVVILPPRSLVMSSTWSHGNGGDRNGSTSGTTRIGWRSSGRCTINSTGLP